MREPFLLIVGTLFALSACSDNNRATTPPAADVTVEVQEPATTDISAMEAETASAPTANSAEVYVTNAAMGDIYEIQSSNLALEKSESETVRQFAQQMITDHTDTTAQLNSTLSSAGLQITPPANLDTRRAGMINTLRNLSGEEFDRAYLEQQAMAHQEALTLHSGFAQNGDNDALKGLAAEIAPKIEHHLGMLTSMDAGPE